MAQAPKIKINKTTKVGFRKGSAREAYYLLLLLHDGQTVDSFVVAAKAKVPSKPKAGKLKGKPEPIQGWLGWFTRNGYCTIK